nr:hypothetical protein OH837_49080 [Streptomyces canus]
MAVITRARIQATEADYRQLSTAEQDKFDRLMRHADKAGPVDYPQLMGRIADLVGLPEGDLRKCGCSCWCGTVFDSNTPDAHVIKHGEGFNLGVHQCPLCADRHRETV